MTKHLTLVVFAALLMGTAACSSKDKTDSYAQNAPIAEEQVEVSSTDPSLGAASSGRGQ